VLPQRPLRLQFVVLTKTRRPEVQTVPVDADPRQVARTRHTARALWQAIRHGHFYPAPSPVLCPTCPFQQACQQWPEEPDGHGPDAPTRAEEGKTRRPGPGTSGN